MVERIEKNMGSEALRAATGRTHEQWRELLAGAGALEWPHKQIAEWLVREHGVDGWWAQGITVDFEQEHKGRLPGQQHLVVIEGLVELQVEHRSIGRPDGAGRQLAGIVGEQGDGHFQVMLQVVLGRELRQPAGQAGPDLLFPDFFIQPRLAQGRAVGQGVVDTLVQAQGPSSRIGCGLGRRSMGPPPVKEYQRQV